MGDYNNCRLDNVLPSFHQYVHIPTRRGSTLDLCYGNITDAFTVCAHPPWDPQAQYFGPSSSVPARTEAHQVHSVAQRSEDAITCLQGSLARTDWSVFDRNLDERVLVITDYIKYCVGNCIPIVTYRTFPNSKPWITSNIRKRQRKTQKICQRKDWVSLKIIDKQIKNDIVKAKCRYKERIEHDFACMNTKQAFQKILSQDRK